MAGPKPTGSTWIRTATASPASGTRARSAPRAAAEAPLTAPETPVTYLNACSHGLPDPAVAAVMAHHLAREIAVGEPAAFAGVKA